MTSFISRTLGMALLLGGLLAGGWVVVDQRFAGQKRARESHFIAIHVLATDALRERDAAGPLDYDGLLEPWGGRQGGLGKPFPDGLVFRIEKGGFLLEEPGRRRISLFQSDRLMATDRKWPRWETSGELARKWSEQAVPSDGFE